MRGGACEDTGTCTGCAHAHMYMHTHVEPAHTLAPASCPRTPRRAQQPRRLPFLLLLLLSSSSSPPPRLLSAISLARAPPSRGRDPAARGAGGVPEAAPDPALSPRPAAGCPVPHFGETPAHTSGALTLRSSPPVMSCVRPREGGGNIARL